MSGRNKLFRTIHGGESRRDAVTADFLNSITAELQRLSAAVGGDVLINGAGVFPRKKSDRRLLGKTTIFHAEGTTRTVDVYVGKTKGSEVKSAKSVQAYNRFADMEQGNWVILDKVNNGWEITVGDPCASASAG